MPKFLFTSESVTEGHPDKICDQISDAILDYAISVDPSARVAVDGAQVKTQFVSVVGEVTANNFDLNKVEKIVRDVIQRIGYTSPDLGFDYKNCKVNLQIEKQSPDIAMGVVKQTPEEQGAGDQGLMFGYAIAHNSELMPLPIALAHKLTKRLSEVRKTGVTKYLWPDGKSQVTIDFDSKHSPKRISAVVLSAHHTPEVTQEYLREELKRLVIEPICGNLIDSQTNIFINPTGKFAIGGPLGDSGLTGRKIIVDTYGGWARHGGGAFSGKDPSKVDRSAAYYARYMAKNVVAAGLAKECEIQLAYAIGVAKPVSIHIDTHGTATIPEEKISKLIDELFDARPGMITQNLDLRRPIYEKTAAYGHFGRNDPDFTWEKTDLAGELAKRASL